MNFDVCIFFFHCSILFILINLFAVNFDMGIVGIFPYMLNLLKNHETHYALTRKFAKPQDHCQEIQLVNPQPTD